MTPKQIKILRAKLGISQDALARALGITTSALCLWEQGRRQPRGPARRLLILLERGDLSLAALHRAARADEETTDAEA